MFCHIDVTVFVKTAFLPDGLNVLDRTIKFPIGAANQTRVSWLRLQWLSASCSGLPVYAANAGRARCGQPLLETGLVYVVSARCFAPDKFFVGLKFHEADGTVALDGLAVAIVVFG